MLLLYVQYVFGFSWSDVPGQGQCTSGKTETVIGAYISLGRSTTTHVPTVHTDSLVFLLCAEHSVLYSKKIFGMGPRYECILTQALSNVFSVLTVMFTPTHLKANKSLRFEITVSL